MPLSGTGREHGHIPYKTKDAPDNFSYVNFKVINPTPDDPMVIIVKL